MSVEYVRLLLLLLLPISKAYYLPEPSMVYSLFLVPCSVSLLHVSVVFPAGFVYEHHLPPLLLWNAITERVSISWEEMISTEIGCVLDTGWLQSSEASEASDKRVNGKWSASKVSRHKHSMYSIYNNTRI